MPQNMYNGQRVSSSDSHSLLCPSYPLLYTGCAAPEATGDLLMAFKGDWQKCPCNKTDPPCLPGHLFPSTAADPPWALLTSTRHTHLAYPHCVFLLSESLLMTSSLWGLNWISTLSCKRPVLKLTLGSVFPGLNSPYIFFLPGYMGSCKNCSKKKKRAERSLWR